MRSMKVGAFLLSVFLAFADLVSISALRQPDDLPGWMGETHASIESGSKSRLKGPDEWAVNPGKVIQLSVKPRAYLYKGFLTDEECDHLVQLAKPKMERSSVADNDSGKSVLSDIRTSSGMFLNKAQDDVVARIEKRIAAWTFLPVENGEAIQVLKYEHGQKYEPHFDYFHDKLNQALGGHRVATVLMYLSHVGKGGETVFPSAEGYTQEKDDTWSDCGKSGLGVKPIKGDALLFFSLHPDATPDEFSLHTGCPVVSGEKWSATKWIHVASFDRPKIDFSKIPCKDEDAKCGEWAAVGECKRNPEFMVGTDNYVGHCRRSCKVCS